MISALPKQSNLVMVENEARTQFFHGVSWIGSDRNPSLTLVESQTEDKPISVQGCDLIMHEGNFAAYGDKKLLRHGIDTVDPNNKLLFCTLFPPGPEALLVRWLVRKTGDMVSNEGILRMAHFVKRNPIHVTGWCSIEPDLFRPDNKAYEVYNEPSPDDIRAIMKAARMGRPAEQRIVQPDASGLRRPRNAFSIPDRIKLVPVAESDSSENANARQEAHSA